MEKEKHQRIINIPEVEDEELRPMTAVEAELAAGLDQAFAETEACEACGGEGVYEDEDGYKHPCICADIEPADFTGATEGDR